MPRILPRPSADTKSVSDLVHLVVTGQVRIPIYQSALRWGGSDVRSLFDSIYRGFPIGSLLLHNRPAPAADIHLGPLHIHAPEKSSAFDVVDGQQRLVALAAALARPEPIPRTPDDPYVVYFDPVDEAFVAPTADGTVPPAWVPLPALADASKLSEWIFNWPHVTDRPLRTRVFEAGARIRDYKVPLYSVAVDEGDADVLREIFSRINTSGKPLAWTTIHDALYGSRSAHTSPSTLDEVTDALAVLGLGRPDKDDILRALIAFEGKDVTRSYKEHERENPRFLEGTAARALPALRRVLTFLGTSAEIPHLRLLPWSAPLPVLTRFFRLHPEPSARSLDLLTWWLWRGFLAIGDIDERTLQRRGVAKIDDDEEASVQRILGEIPAVAPNEYELPSRFDARAAQTRITLLGMASLQPRDLSTGRPLDISALLEESGLEAFRRVFSKGSSPANRILLAGRGPARNDLLAALRGPDLLAVIRGHDPGPHMTPEIARSHALSPDALTAFKAQDQDTFLRERSTLLLEATRTLATRLTGWTRSTRPSLDYLLRSAAE